ncbi:MAG: hypothetical protein M1839_006274 [Geoglossum umbratile]|nr:MAG: hypothetical protein M1839_006274 [Geoglossum umbratile]
MLSCHAACRRAVQRSLDEAPANAFCRSIKRYGSSVPGPLESQRRLSKRRVTNLTVAGGGTGFDLGAFTGPEGWLERCDWKWQAPSAVRPQPSGKDTALSDVPSWLANAVSAPAAALTAVDKKLSDGEEVAIRSRPRRSEIIQPEPRLELSDDPSLLTQALSLATDVDQVQRAIANITKLSQDPPGPDYGALVIQRLLDLHAPADVLIDFLANPAVNFSGAQIIRNIFQHFGRRPVTRQMHISIASVLKQTMALGLVSDEEIREILWHVPSLVSQVHTNPGDTAVLPLYISIWEGIQSCSVLPVRDLAGGTLSLLLCQLKPIPFSIEIRRLGISIIKSASIPQLRDMKRGVSSFLANWVREYRGSTLDSKVGRLEPVVEMVELLNGLPNELAQSFVSSTTSALLLQKVVVIEEESPCDRLYQWVDIVSQCPSVSKSGAEWRAIEDILAADRSQRRVARYLMGLGSKQTCEFFLRYWVHYEIEERGCGHRAYTVFHNMQRRFRSMCKGPDDPRAYFNVLLALHQLGLPYGTVAMELFSLMRHLSRYTAMVDVARSMQDHGLLLGHGEVSHIIHGVGEASPSSALRLLSLFPMVKPEDHKGLLCLAIRNKLLYAKDIFALIKNNARLRAGRKPNADLLHSLALAFAHSPHLTPRAALRYAHWCWLGLRRYKLPLNPMISRALAHAGITRSLQAGRWVSSVKLKWILELVGKLEGKAVADELDVAVFSWRGRVIEDRKQETKGVSLHGGTGFGQTDDISAADVWGDDEWGTVVDKTTACSIND